MRKTPAVNPSATKVALVEDHVILAEALRVALTLHGCDVGVHVPQVRGGLKGLLTSIVDASPRVVVLDLDLGPLGDGLPLIQPLSRGGHRVVVLTACENRLRWGAALAHGAVTVLTKAVPLQVILDVIERTDCGLPVMAPAERSRLIHSWRQHQPDSDEHLRQLSRLTPREKHVLSELMRGKRVREIAAEAVVSEATVRTQVKAILAKLGVSSQLAAVAVARDLAWPPPQPVDTSTAPQAARRDR